MDPKLTDFEAQDLGVAFKRVLRGDIETLERDGHESKDRADVDDATGASLAHVREHIRNHPHGSPEIGLELFARFLRRCFLDAAEQSEARVVNENIQSSLTLLYVVNDGACVLLGADIELQHLYALRARPLFGLAACAKRPVVARSEECRRLEANA